ncbi:MAG: non-ribosomal peptide synthetase, partial [bacterium]|nr:non-ribosomal peptide synthetase [bacterium]
IGSPLQNTCIYILDHHLKLCPIGVKGEIYVAGPGVGPGYWRSPGKTALSFIPNHYVEDNKQLHYNRLYRTGDLGRWLENGVIEFFGRIDHQVKVRGFRVELGEIEVQLAKHDNIIECVVTHNKSKGNDTYLSAYIVAEPEPDPDELKEFLAATLPDYMIPSYFIPISAVPVTSNGKVDRTALLAIKQPDKDNLAVPTTPVQKMLAEIWSQVLGIRQAIIGIDTNFFELGGNSLNAIKLGAKVHK